MSRVIRKATPEDLYAVEAIVFAAYTIYVARIGRKPAPMLDDYVVLIERQQVHVLVDDGTIQGLVVLIPEEATMLLDNVAVNPEAQGRGYGATLLTYSEAAASDAGFASIRLFTHELMTENRARYARLGYVETHRATEKGLQRVFMTKRLSRECP